MSKGLVDKGKKNKHLFINRSLFPFSNQLILNWL